MKKIVKKLGNSGYILMPKELIDKEVTVLSGFKVIEDEPDPKTQVFANIDKELLERFEIHDPNKSVNESIRELISLTGSIKMPTEAEKEQRIGEAIENNIKNFVSDQMSMGRELVKDELKAWVKENYVKK